MGNYKLDSATGRSTMTNRRAPSPFSSCSVTSPASGTSVRLLIGLRGKGRQGPKPTLARSHPLGKYYPHLRNYLLRMTVTVHSSRLCRPPACRIPSTPIACWPVYAETTASAAWCPRRSHAETPCNPGHPLPASNRYPASCRE